MLIELPTPANFEELLWLGIGLMFARAFAQSDHALQETEWFMTLGTKFEKWLVKSFMDFFHHWWIGAIFVVYSVEIAGMLSMSSLIVYWLGWGVLIDDLPDIPTRLKKYFPALRNGLYG